MEKSRQENINNVLTKLVQIDEIMKLLGSVHEADVIERNDLIKKYSNRKIVLAKEAYTLFSNLTI